MTVLVAPVADAAVALLITKAGLLTAFMVLSALLLLAPFNGLGRFGHGLFPQSQWYYWL